MEFYLAEVYNLLYNLMHHSFEAYRLIFHVDSEPGSLLCRVWLARQHIWSAILHKLWSALPWELFGPSSWS